MIEEAQKFVNEKEDMISLLNKNLSISYWEASISGKKDDYDKYSKSDIELKRLLSSKEDFEKLKKYKSQKFGGLLDRQIKLLYNAFLSGQGDFSISEKIAEKAAEAEMKFNTFRAKIRESEFTENQIKEILKKEADNSKLEEAWKAIKKQGELVEKVILELVHLRNIKARDLGFDNFYEFSLEIGEQNEKEIENIFLELEKLTNKPFYELKQELDAVLAKKFEIEKYELKPWHYGDPFFQEGPSVFKIDLDNLFSDDILKKAVRYYESLGIDVDGIVERSDLYEKPGKNQHAYCMDVDRKGDVRTMQNIKNDEYWMDTVLHEFGHAIYSENHDKELPWLLRDSAHTFTTEAIAMLFGRKPRNSEFIKNYCEISESGSGELQEAIKKSLRFKQLVFARWALVMFHFERELYKNPNQNLNKLWWDLVKRFQLIDFFRDKPDWASKVHFVTAPVYYHNYLLGEVLASQFHHYITEHFTHDENSDYSGKKEVGNYFIEKVFRPGAKYRWDEFIKNATGEKLTAKYFVEEFC